MVLTQLTGSGLMAMASLGLATGASETNAVEQAFTVPQVNSDQIASAAAAAVNAALGISLVGVAKEDIAKPDEAPKEVTGVPSRKIMVHNVFNREEETEGGWEEDIKEDFEEECTKYGKITNVKVESEKAGGIIYVVFDSMEDASVCAKALSGRWFDKRQLKVEFVDGEV